MRIAINGFGRIGRTFLRTILEDPAAIQTVEVAAINIGPAPQESVAYAFKYDSIMGTFPAPVIMRDNELYVGDYIIPIIAEPNPEKIEWQRFDVEWVVESSGFFTHREGAVKHIESGAHAVLITAPAEGEDISLVLGVNDDQFDLKKHKIVSLGSCTTNALVPILHVLHRTFTVEKGFMTTVHAYTTTQMLLDGMAKKMRRGRAAALNIVPTTTGATKVLGKVLPDLSDRIGGVALRVPVANISLIDLVVITKQSLSIDKIHETYKNAITNDMGGIIDLTMEPLVSSDFMGNNHSVVIDGLSTDVIQENTARILGWYDNEWGYCQRLKDFFMHIVAFQK
jgi:glyceraldehyde 3-phosphate dehydrogenase